MSGPLVYFWMSYTLVCMTLKQLLLTKKSGIIGFNSIFGLVSESLGTEDV